MELIRLEEGTLIVAEQVINAIKNFESEKKQIEEQEKLLREKLAKAMNKYNKTSWESPDGSLKVSYTPESETTRFDTKKFKEEHLDMYYDYQVPSKRKESIRITIRDEKEEVK